MCHKYFCEKMNLLRNKKQNIEQTKIHVQFCKRRTAFHSILKFMRRSSPHIPTQVHVLLPGHAVAAVFAVQIFIFIVSEC